MYRNDTKIFLTLGIWSVIVVFATLGAIVSLGVTFDDKPLPDPVPMLGRIVGLISFALYMVFIAIVHLRRRRQGEGALVMETESPFEFEEA